MQYNYANTAAYNCGLIVAIVLVPVLGRLSDAFGRKLVVMWGATVNALIPVSVALYLWLGIPFYTYYLALALNPTSPFAVALLSSVVDVSSSDNRARNVGPVMACMLVGVVLGTSFMGECVCMCVCVYVCVCVCVCVCALCLVYLVHT